ncbi:peroxide stress protein YaaA [Dysosmobacter sp. HCP28S3_G4]|uniref:peroxide stress protein YaaA n=1 Tax=Dysosmobacter sp. HCP28S3_G4 TaxID=3438938 RepID=UPI003F8A1B30
MRIVISPAKKMNVDTDTFPCHALPRFLDRTERLLARLRELSPRELQALWRCNEQIAALNVERLSAMDLRRRLTPALLSYEGIQYRYMAPSVFTAEELAYVEEHLRILSGFYGLLRPFDGVTPYRLEMQAKLAVDGCRDLYQFWGDSLAAALAKETDTIVDLASWEYGHCVARHLPVGVRRIICVFGELKGGKVVEKGTLCKMARGEMVRYMAEHRVEDPAELRNFDRLSYVFSPEHSDEGVYVFLKEAADR